MKQELICIRCPIGCMLTYEDGKITGNKCKRGVEYGLEEVISPKRIITSTVKTTNEYQRRISVKTESSIPKEMMFKVVEEINKITIDNDVVMGQTIIKNILNTGVNVISTQELKY